MAIALVQSVGVSQLFVNPVSVPIAPSGAGNLIVVSTQGGVQITGISDNAGNTYALVPGSLITGGAGLVINIWYAYNITAGATSLSITLNGTANAVFEIAEFSGVSTSSPIDVSATLGGTAPPALGPSLTITNPGNLLYCQFDKQTIDPTAVSSPWAIMPNSYYAGAGLPYVSYIINPGSTGTYQPNFTPAGTDAFIGSAVSFLPPSVPNISSMFLVF
jgi:hypothetical protein